MAKKKEIEDSSSEAALKAIKKKYGNIIKTGSQVFDRKKELKTLKISPCWDLALNGGLQEASWNIVSGAPKSGKTTLILQIIANAQKEGRKAIYNDFENRLRAYNLNGITGLDKDLVTVVSTGDEDSDEVLGAEDVLSVTEELIKLPEYKGCICVIDSTSSLLTRNEMAAEVSGTLRANMPKLWAHWIKKVAPIVSKNRIIMILITHYITNTSGYGKLKVADGGMQIQYQADTRIDFDKVEPWEESGKKIGQIVKAEVNCSSLGASGNSLTTYIRYNKGIDSVKEAIHLGEQFGLIEKAGAWFTLPFLAKTELSEVAEQKFQGSQAVYDVIASNPKMVEILSSEVQSLLSE